MIEFLCENVLESETESKTVIEAREKTSDALLLSQHRPLKAVKTSASVV